MLMMWRCCGCDVNRWERTWRCPSPPPCRYVCMSLSPSLTTFLSLSIPLFFSSIWLLHFLTLFFLLFPSLCLTHIFLPFSSSTVSLFPLPCPFFHIQYLIIYKTPPCVAIYSPHPQLLLLFTFSKVFVLVIMAQLLSLFFSPCTGPSIW